MHPGILTIAGYKEESERRGGRRSPPQQAVREVAEHPPWMETLRPAGSHPLVSPQVLWHSQSFMSPLGSKDRLRLVAEFSVRCDHKINHPQNTAGAGGGDGIDMERLGHSRTKRGARLWQIGAFWSSDSHLGVATLMWVAYQIPCIANIYMTIHEQ